MKKKPFLMFLVVTILFSCNNSRVNNPKQKLLEAFQTQKIDTSWNFETIEDDSTITSAFKNKAIDGRIILTSPDTIIVFGFFSKENKVTHSSMFFKSELIRRDSILYIETKDPSNKLIGKIDFPTMKNRIPEDGSDPPGPGGFDSLEECIDNFERMHLKDLQDKANKTCKPVRSEIVCCFKDKNCVYILIAVSPNKPSCNIPYPYENILTR